MYLGLKDLKTYRSLQKYKIASVTASGGQHHGTSVCFLCCNVSCLNNEIRRKQKAEFDKTSNVGPLTLKRLRPVKNRELKQRRRRRKRERHPKM